MFNPRILAAWTVSAVTLVQAANMVPDYEVKLLMNPSAVLGADYKLTPTVLSTFSMPTSVTKMNVQFLDTSDKVIYNAEWSPRMRKIEGQSDFELTYKKRYPISNGDIDAALTTAANEGFDSSTTTYDAQVEWGYQKQTLSISRQKTASSSGYSGMDLPGTSTSRTMMMDNAPDKFNNWVYNGWGKNNLSISRLYGPILAKRSIGTWSGYTLYIEVWPLKSADGTSTEYVVEASFKTTDRNAARAKHDELQSFLESKGWFLAQDSLKTALIMQRY